MDDNLEKVWLELKEKHAEYLDKYGVKLPREGTAKQIWLSVLYEAHKINPSAFVDKNEISRIVMKFRPDLGMDQQVRHLKRDGWNLITEKQGRHRLEIKEPSPSFAQDATRTTNLLLSENFDDLKVAHNNSCVSCGAKEGQAHQQYHETVQLQRAHKDPSKPLAIENTIPQCQFCNRSYKSDFTFDDKGRIRAVASVNPVKRASPRIQKIIWKFLRDKFGRGN